MTASSDERRTKKELIEELQSLRKRVSALETSQDNYKQAGELLNILRINSPIGVFIGQDRKFVFTNKQFQKVLGFTGAKLEGTYTLERVCEEDREMVRENAIQMLKGERTEPYKYRIISKDGQIRWMLEGVLSIEYRGQRAVLGHALDITNRIETEAKLRSLYENERKLREELESEVNKRIEFTRALVHELKTPLTPVLLSSELLVSELKEEPWLSVAGNIHRGASNLNNRIDELLDLARVEIGGMQINLKLVDSHQLLSNIASYVESLISKNRQRLVVDISTTLPKVWADGERLQQVIMNLLINASKFTPEGGTITLSAQEKDNNFMVEVKDTGSGIPKKEQQRIFQPYERRRTDRERLSGLGLGLSLCKYLVELHGGEIWVKSRGGKGSTFTFYIPLEPPAQTEGNGQKERTSEAVSNRR